MNQEIVTKKCSKCQEVKPINEFYRNKSKIDGFHNQCIVCKKNFIKNNPDKIKNYKRKHYKENKTKISQKCKHYYKNNKEKINNINKTYANNHKIAISNYLKNYKFNNKEKIRILSNKRFAIRYNLDPIFKLYHNLKRSIHRSLKGKYKIDHSINLLGCKAEYYKSILELQFYGDMTWKDNGKGYGKWQIHHTGPLEYFDLTDPVEQKQAYHYTNTQPLWYEDHCEIHRKIDERMSQYDPKDVYPWKYK